MQLALDMQDQLVALCKAEKLNGVEAGELLGMLKLTEKHAWAKQPEVIGTMLKHIAPEVLQINSKRRRFWITPPTK